MTISSISGRSVSALVPTVSVEPKSTDKPEHDKSRQDQSQQQGHSAPTRDILTRRSRAIAAPSFWRNPKTPVNQTVLPEPALTTAIGKVQNFSMEFDGQDTDDYGFIKEKAKEVADEAILQFFDDRSPSEKSQILELIRKNGGITFDLKLSDTDGQDNDYSVRQVYTPGDKDQNLDNFIKQSAETFADYSIRQIRDVEDEGAINIAKTTLSLELPKIIEASSSLNNLTPGQFQASTIFGTSKVRQPDSSLSQQKREERIDAYASRVTTQLAGIESGSEAERNVKFLNARPFITPTGYFSGGLMAAGYDPNEKIVVTYTTYVGKGKPESQTGTSERTYAAWEIAAGILEHDRPERGGPINFAFREFTSPEDERKAKDLESVGNKLQARWEGDVAKPTRDSTGILDRRSGKADAYSVRATLENLRRDKDSFKQLSSEGTEAVKRTLDQNGQVIIPNVYGYPLAGYAFIPYTPHDGKYEHRPNQGLLIDLGRGVVSEIHGDDDFANWAGKNRDHLLQSFNASDMQGGRDVHWPKAGDVLDNLIRGKGATYPGYENLVKDQAIPVRETFNYTESRGGDYRLKYGNLATDGDDGIASKYQAVNAKNAIWSDQTQVFGSSQQNWKSAKGIWNNTFGYLPVVGNAGNIVFGVHDGIYGMTADDRIGGNAAAVISSLQLAHELAPSVAESSLGETSSVFKPSTTHDYGWNYNSKAREFEFTSSPKLKSGTGSIDFDPEDGSTLPGGDKIEQATGLLSPSKAGKISAYAAQNGEQLIKDIEPNAKGIYQVSKGGKDSWYIRYADDTGISNVYEIRSDFKLSDDYVQIIDPKTRKPVMTVHKVGEQWQRIGQKGGAPKFIVPLEMSFLDDAISNVYSGKKLTPGAAAKIKNLEAELIKLKQDGVLNIVDDLAELARLKSSKNAQEYLVKLQNISEKSSKQIEKINEIKAKISEFMTDISAKPNNKKEKIMRLISAEEREEILNKKEFTQGPTSFEQHKWFYTDNKNKPVQSKNLPYRLEIEVPEGAFKRITEGASADPKGTLEPFRYKPGGANSVEQHEPGAFGVQKFGLPEFSGFLQDQKKFSWKIVPNS